MSSPKAGHTNSEKSNGTSTKNVTKSMPETIIDLTLDNEDEPTTLSRQLPNQSLVTVKDKKMPIPMIAYSPRPVIVTSTPMLLKMSADRDTKRATASQHIPASSRLTNTQGRLILSEGDMNCKSAAIVVSQSSLLKTTTALLAKDVRPCGQQSAHWPCCSYYRISSQAMAVENINSPSEVADGNTTPSDTTMFSPNLPAIRNPTNSLRHPAAHR